MVIKIILSESDDPIKHIEGCLDIIHRIENLYEKKENIALDFSEVSWILPCSALLLGGKIDEIKNQNIKINFISPTNEKVKKYLLDIGFPFGTQELGKTYHSINHFGSKDNVNEKVNKLFHTMEDKIPKQFGVTIQYLLAELTDNIEQHSHFTHSSIMAQFFPHKNYIDIGILDNGLSIPKVFEDNGIPFSEDFEAIEKAMAGVTTKKGDISRGFGLQSTKKIVRDLCDGELHIISRHGALIFEHNSFSKKYKFINNSLKGTLIYIRLKT